MTKKLFVSAITKFTAGVILLALLLFLPAGTVHYPGGWLLMGILFIPMFLAGLAESAQTAPRQSCGRDWQRFFVAPLLARHHRNQTY